MRPHSLLLVAFCLAGCASPPPEETQPIVGVVASTSTASTRVGRPGPFTLVGAAGGLVATAAADAELHIHNRLYIRTAAGELTVDTDQYFPAGSCVQILPFARARSSRFFPYNSASIVRAEHC